MNLYAIHPDPKNAPYREWAYENIPVLVWERYQFQPEELKKREQVLAQSGLYAYLYARDVLRGPFPAGEPAIANSVKALSYHSMLRWYEPARAETFRKSIFMRYP